MVLSQSPDSPVIWGYANYVGLPMIISMLGVNYDVTSFEGKLFVYTCSFKDTRTRAHTHMER